jgi:hypothetical protein
MSKAPSDPPPKPIKLNYLPHKARDQFGRVGRWLADCFERDNLIAGLKTLLWLVPMTVLIWIYAEREQVRPLEDQTIPIDVRSNDPNVYVKLMLSGLEKSIIADLSGPRSKLDELLTDIQPQEGKASVVVTIPDGLSPGQIHEPDIAQLLNNHPMFQRRGITVSNCKPSNIKVFVDKFEEQELEVVKSDGVTNLASEPIFEPKTVRVRAPTGAWATARQSGSPKVVADLAGSGLLNVPGPHDTTVRVEVPKLVSDRIDYDPPSVRASFEVRASSKEGILRQVPVKASMPVEMLSKYTVKECPVVIFNVRIVGPADKVAELERPDSPIKPVAVLDVERSDVPTPKERRFRFEGLPEGVRVMDEDANKAYPFKLVEKAPE